MENFLPWIPGVLALLALGVWAGRLESLNKYLEERSTNTEKRIKEMDQVGTRAMATEIQRMSAGEAATRSIESRLIELDVKFSELDRRFAVLQERQRQVIRTVDVIIRRRGNMGPPLDNGDNNGDNH